MFRRLNLIFLAISLIVIAGFPSGSFALTDPSVPIADLSSHLGHTVTIYGRTGYIVSHYEKEGMHVFTVRDDYNNEALVNTIGATYPVMGVTYRVTGVPTIRNNVLFLDTTTTMFAPVYPVTAPTPVAQPASPKSAALVWIPMVLSSLAILMVLAYFLSRWVTRTLPEWGELTITSGPDRGLTVPLSRNRTAIGRGVSPEHDIRLSPGDQTISNRHALLLHRQGQMFYCDMSSNGSRIGGEKLMAGKPIKVNSGDLIHIGTQGTVAIIHQHADDMNAGAGIFGMLRETAPLAEKTIMLPESNVDEPAWKTPHPDFKALEESAAAYTPGHLEEEHSSYPSGEVFVNDYDDDEDDIPITFAPPVVFKFAGHEPRRQNSYSDNNPDQEDPED